MKMGVCTTPWFSVRRPRRAWPSVARMSNWSMSGVPALQQHGVAVAEEAVAAVNRVAVGGHDGLVAREGADQHQQRRLGQVEVGDEDVDDAEAKTGRDEDVGLAANP